LSLQRRRRACEWTEMERQNLTTRAEHWGDRPRSHSRANSQKKPRRRREMKKKRASLLLAGRRPRPRGAVCRGRFTEFGCSNQPLQHLRPMIESIENSVLHMYWRTYPGQMLSPSTIQCPEERHANCPVCVTPLSRNNFSIITLHVEQNAHLLDGNQRISESCAIIFLLTRSPLSNKTTIDHFGTGTSPLRFTFVSLELSLSLSNSLYLPSKSSIETTTWILPRPSSSSKRISKWGLLLPPPPTTTTPPPPTTTTTTTTTTIRRRRTRRQQPLLPQRRNGRSNSIVSLRMSLVGRSFILIIRIQPWNISFRQREIRILPLTSWERGLLILLSPSRKRTTRTTR